MKLFNTVFVLVMMVALTGCPSNKKKSGGRFEDRGARANGVTQSAQQVAPTALVTAYDRSSWMSSVRRLVSASIPENYLMEVSPDGTNNTGVFVGARLCVTQGYGNQQVPQKAMIVIHVYDSYQVPVPIYLNSVQGSISNGIIDVIFQDDKGQIRLYGQQVNQQQVQGVIQFNTRVKSDGTADSYGWETLGTFNMLSQQLFACY